MNLEDWKADCEFPHRLSPSSMSTVLSRTALTTKTRSTWKSLQSSLPNPATFEKHSACLLGAENF